MAPVDFERSKYAAHSHYLETLLPVAARIKFKSPMPTYKVVFGSAPNYLNATGAYLLPTVAFL